MQGGFVRGICFLAFLLSSGIKGENDLSSQDQLDDESDRSTSISIAITSDDDLSVGSPRSLIHSRPSALASTQASAITDGYNIGMSPYGYPSASSDSALANAVANTNAESGAASAQASASAHDYNIGSSPSGYPSYLGESALANAFANAGKVNPYRIPSWRSDDPQAVNEKLDFDEAFMTNEPLGSLPSGLQINADSKSDLDENEEKNLSVRSGLPWAGAISRVVSPYEYIIPSTLPGGEYLIVCQAENEIHQIRTQDYQCLVCVCIKEGWQLRSVCVNCNSCMEAPQPHFVPEVPIIPSPLPPPYIPPPPPQPESQVSCAPLPENVPFQNPLNPCQICICERTFNVFHGQLDVQIQCKEDPRCTTLPDLPEPLPSLPVLPPLPYPVPELPQILPTPVPEILPPWPSLVPEYIPMPSPVPEILPPSLPPMPEYLPPVPSLVPELPYIETAPLPLPLPEPEIEPIPWPPIVPMWHRPKSPLPGPPPHETCKPYPADQPFQHPWDECQICVCSEIRVFNVINIEVNCYTKPACCVEPPISEQNLLPAPYNMNPSSIITFDEICEYRSLLVDFIHPKDMCKICNCQTFGNMIIPVCRPTNEPGCNINSDRPPRTEIIYIEPKCIYQQPYETFLVDCQICSCQVVFQYVISKCKQLPNCGTNNYPWIGSSSNVNALSQSNADLYSLLGPSSNQAQSEAIANAQNAMPGGLYGNYPYYAGGISPSSAQIQAEVLANAQNAIPGGLYGNYPYHAGGIGQSSAQAQAEAVTNAQNAIPGRLYDNYPYYTGGISQSTTQAQAEAIANAQNAISGGLYGNYPDYAGGISQSSAQAQAEAIANAQNAMSGGLYGNYPDYSGGISQSSAQAQAEAIANAQNVIPGRLHGNYPYYAGGIGQSSAQAQAEAIANTQNAIPGELYGNYPYYAGGQPTLGQAEAISNAQAAELGGLYGGNSLTSAQAQAEAISNANYPYVLGGDSQSNALSPGLTMGLSPYGIFPYNFGGENAQAEANAQLLGLRVNNINPHLIGGQSTAQAQAEALANAIGGQSSAQAQAEALSNAISGQSSAISQAEALANAIGGQSIAQSLANAQSSNLYGPYVSYPGSSQANALAEANAVAASQLYPNLYPLPGGSVTNLYQPLGERDVSSLAQAQALSEAQGQSFSQALAHALANAQNLGQFMPYSQSQSSPTSQSLAQTASILGRPLIKSGTGFCKYNGDKYHHNCQACYCFSENDGGLYSLCLGNPCA